MINRGALRCEGIRLSYGGVLALDNLSLAVAPNSFVALIGPNGSGKTSMLNVISGVQRRALGQINLDGLRIEGLSLVARTRFGMARTFQTLRLFDSLTVLENVMCGAHRLYRHSAFMSCLHLPHVRREIAGFRAKAIELLAIYGDRLLPRLDHQVTTLSYANRRRVEIARAMMADPVILLLDEPAAGMNPSETEQLALHLRALAQRAGCSVLLVEHKMDFITELCSKVYVLDHGVCLAHGSPEKIRQDPMVMEAFLGVD
jgi:branched-chain amino acid transport system permease protein